MKDLRCFVAMAFSHPDTDRLYDKVVRPLLRTLSIEAVRVDRIEHQERVDQFIINQIQSADFAIADLTYARPSVYFEAGFAERKIPVIYTCRTDHFSGAKNASSSDYKVHFDLLTKNIVSWSEPSDGTFPRRLKTRLQYVIAPLLRDKSAEESRRSQIQEFAVRPLNERLETVGNILEESIRTTGSGLLKMDSILGVIPYDVTINAKPYIGWGAKHFNPMPTNLIGQCAARSFRKSVLEMTFGFVVSSLTRKQLHEFKTIWQQHPLYDLTPPGGIVKKLQEHYIFCSTGRLNVSSTMNILHDFSKQGDALIWDTTQQVPIRKPNWLTECYQLSESRLILVNRRARSGPDYRGYVIGGRFEELPHLRLGAVPRSLLLSFVGNIKTPQEARERITEALRNKPFK